MDKLKVLGVSAGVLAVTYCYLKYKSSRGETPGACVEQAAASNSKPNKSSQTVTRTDEEQEQEQEEEEEEEPFVIDPALMASAQVQGASSTNTSTKRLFFVRHGQSQYNELYEKNWKDPMLFDADLTTKGESQAREAGEVLRSMGANIELCITSPLTRAIRTCVLAMPPTQHDHIPYVVWPESRETLEASCDIGSSVTELSKKYPALSFEQCPEIWWHLPDDLKGNDDPLASREYFSSNGYCEEQSHVEERIQVMLNRIWERPEKSVAVFCHADFINETLARFFNQPDKWLANGEVVEVALAKLHDSTHGDYSHHRPSIMQ